MSKINLPVTSSSVDAAARAEAESGPDVELARSRGKRRLLLAFPTLLAFSVCFFRLGRRRPWIDEHSTWWASSLSFEDLARLLENVDIVLAPYYLLVHGVISIFGDAPWALRLPSAVAMTVAAGLLTLLGRRLFNDSTGILAGCLFALIPSVSAYAQEARPYALALAAVLASTLLLLRATSEPARWTSWLAYALSLTAIGLSHLVSLLVLACHAALVLLHPSEKGPGRAASSSSPLRLSPLVTKWIGVCCLGVLPVLPVVWLGRQQSGQISWIRADWHAAFDLPSTLFRSGTVGGAVMILGITALFLIGRPLAISLALWAVFPPVFLFAVRDVVQLFLHRYLLFTVPAWALLAAAAAHELFAPQRARIRGFAAVAFTLAMLGFPEQLRTRQRTQSPEGAEQPDYFEVRRIIDKMRKPGDAVVYAGSNKWRVKRARLGLSYEMREREPLRDIFIKVPANALGGFVAEECPSSAVCLPPDVQRIWLVSYSPGPDPFKLMSKERSQLLMNEFETTFTKESFRLTVQLLTRRPPRNEET